MSSHDELNVVCTQLSSYFDAVAANVTSTSNPIPSFEDYVDLLVVDSILTEAVQNEKGSANYSDGAKTDIAHLAFGIQREFNIRLRTKNSYYTNAPTTIAIESDAYTVMYGKYLNYFRGSSPEQRGR